jgi:hypothetical protein
LAQTDKPRQFPRPPYEWRGIVSVILAVGVVISLVDVSLGNEHLNAEEATLLSTVLGALVGALATFIGVAGNGHKQDDEK